jgi:UDP-N-acetylglucosamine enolpyruvyl transferase
LTAVIEKLEDCDVLVERLSESFLKTSASGGIVCQDVTTREYPGFATDMQAHPCLPPV